MHDPTIGYDLAEIQTSLREAMRCIDEAGTRSGKGALSYIDVAEREIERAHKWIAQVKTKLND